MPPGDTLFFAEPHESQRMPVTDLWASAEVSELAAYPRQLRPAEAKILELSEKAIKKPEERIEFAADLDIFTGRMQAVDAAAADKFYEQVSRLMEGRKSYAGVSQTQQIELAEQIVHHAAFPEGINQGHHATCGSAVLEAEMYSRDPVDAARVVTSVAMNGNFITADGKKAIRPSSSTLKPDDEAQPLPTPDGWRDYASQIFQESAITAVYPSFHELHKARTDEDTGERISEWRGKPPRRFEKHFDGLWPRQVQQMNKAVAGDRNPLVIIENARFNEKDGQLHVASEEALKNTLDALSKNCSLPAIIQVNAGHEPFYAQIHSGGWHYVSLTRYDAKGSKVDVDNQWGKDSDLRGISTQRVFLSTDGVDTQSLKELQQEVLKNRKSKMDILLELELIRREKEEKLLKPDDYKLHLEILMRNARAQWSEQEKNGTVDNDERKRLVGEFNYAIRHLPPKDRREVESLKLLELPSQPQKR